MIPSKPQQALARTREVTVARARTHCQRVCEAMFADGVAAWARDDSAPFPNRGELHDQVWAELEILCRALSSWAAVPPSELFTGLEPDVDDFYDEPWPW